MSSEIPFGMDAVEFVRLSLTPVVMGSGIISHDPDDTRLLELNAQEACLVLLLVQTADDPVLGPIVEHPVGKRLLEKMHDLAAGR